MRNGARVVALVLVALDWRRETMSAGSLPNAMRNVLLLALLTALPLASSAQSSFSGSYPLLDDGDVIGYQSKSPNDSVARLQRRLDQGQAKLTFQGPHGYLLSVLQQLGVPLSSQTLVFSKTSAQQRLIGPATPQALYFNDSVYVGSVQIGRAHV
jgi:hypothetical protein